MMRASMWWAAKIKELLEKGLYVNNLREVGDIAWEEVKGGQSKFAPFVMYQICGGLAEPAPSGW
jgi:hypothetical protein